MTAWDTATPFAVAATPGNGEDDPTMSSDSTELFYAYSGTTPKEIAYSGAPFSSASVVPELNTTSNDGGPRLTYDGNTMYLMSDRPGGLGGDDIYVSTRAGTQGTWTTPTLVAPLSSAFEDRTATPCMNGTAWVLASDRDGTDFDLYEAGVDGVLPLDAVNTDDGELSPFVSEDCHTLYFARKAINSWDLYVAVRGDSDTFSAPERIEGLSTEDADEMDPWVSPDGRHILFTRGSNNEYDIYEAYR
jgi:Tol biopolymer transport system component